MVQETYGTQILAFIVPSALLFATFVSVLAKDDVADGKLAFNNSCRTCHVTDKGDNRLGPNLHAIIGRKAGAAQNFPYSSAFSSADFKWTKGKLDSFIADPDAIVPGNKMKPYSGIADDDQRRKIIAYLVTQSAGADD